MSNTQRKALFIVALIVVLLVIFTNIRQVYTPTAGISDGDVLKIPVVYEEDIPSSAIDEVQEAAACLPAGVIRTFKSDGWKFSLKKNIDAPDIYPSTAVGETDFKNRTITIQADTSATASGVTDVVMVRSLHELMHYVDYFFGSSSDKPDWQELYEDNTDYVEYDFAGVGGENASYAASDRHELFACAGKDYLLHKDYVKENAPDLYRYFKNLLG